MPSRQDHLVPLLEVATRSLDEQPLAISTVARSVIRMTSDSNVSIKELARAVSSDPGLAGKIIKTANSAFYAGPAIVSSIPEAITKLGFTATRSVAITASVQALYQDGGQGELKHDLWTHSLAAGIAARIVIQHIQTPLAEEAFLCALLHDIAKLVLLQRFPEIYEPILRRTLLSEDAPLEHELTCMGFTHADLGAMILERWAFGESSIRAVRFHHDPPRAGSDADPDAVRRDAYKLARAVSVADSLARILAKAADSDGKVDLSNVPGSKLFGFSPAELDQILLEISYRVGDELQVFGQSDVPMYVSRRRNTPCAQ